MKSLTIFTLMLFSCIQVTAQSFTKLNQPPLTTKNGDFYSTSAIDIDNNYTLDLVVGYSNFSTSSLYINDGFNVFLDSSSNSTVVSQTSAGYASWADYNNDCLNDVYWVTNQPASAPFYKNQGDRNFINSGATVVNSSIVNSVASAWADVDNNGHVDLFVPNMNGGAHHLYLNSGNNNFTRIDTGIFVSATGSIHSCAWGDYDNDGDADLFLGNNSGNNYLLINKGGAKFELDTGIIGTEGSNSVSAIWADLDKNGFLDLFIARFNDKNLYYQNNGDGTFTKITAGPIVNDIWKSNTCAAGDVDNDGDLDILVTHGGNGSPTPNRNVIFINNGFGLFSKMSAGSVYQETYNSTGCGIADINNDGALDILIANRSAAVSVHLNNGNANNYLKLALYGTTANRLAVGTKVEISSATLGNQIIYTGQSSKISPNYEVMFGLGTDTIVDTLRIYWPGNSMCEIYNVPLNAFYNIGQGACSLDTVVEPDFSDSSSFLTAHFTDLSKGSISNYTWYFGDGDSSNLQNPSHHYTQAGDYIVKLKIEDAYCKSRSVIDTITICPDTATLGFINTVLNLQASFTDISTVVAYNYSWDFGDGNIGTGKTVNHLYAATGTYNVCLTVTDSCRSKQICRTIQICNTGLAASFNDSIIGKTVNFTNASSFADSIYWTFGDGSASSQLNPIHVYSSPGTYFACVTAYDNCSSTTYCDSIEICPDVTVAGFAYNSNQTLVNFTDNSQFADSWHWDFGDGSFSNLQNPVKSYPAFGIYTVCLTSSSDCNTDSICQTINLCPYQAQASYTYTKGVIPTAVQFNNTSVDAVSYHWDFGDGSSSIQKNPLKVFANVQVYNVCLSVTDSCGNTNQYCEALDISTIGLGELPISPILIYPNPVSDILTIDMGTMQLGEISLHIYDLSAKMLFNEQYILNNQKEIILDVKKFPKGSYILKVKNSGDERNFRITKF